MRVVSRMRAAAPGRAIVAGLAILAGCALGGCGQRGPLYLPTVPPLPAKPIDRTPAPSPDTTDPAAQNPAAVGEIPDTSGSPLSLAPETELAAPPASAASATDAPLPASAATPAQ
ncbi:LPS translocon maturation chaperone LptM [Paraburkholderia sp. BCC1884]|uniref:LPS translocon maturation chaperone LptM n=1 Tax=Paraburkholderia sp. BCC1884 TaxID=2562668 RepID=UPI001181F42B|nr:lipoprotein [Paraburkholderia sp. BCC1884]